MVKFFARVHTLRVCGNEFFSKAKNNWASTRDKLLTILEVIKSFKKSYIILTLCGVNQWTGFYMISPSVMKELKDFSKFWYFTIFCKTNFLKEFYILTARSVPCCSSIMNPFYCRLSQKYCWIKNPRLCSYSR